MPEPGSARTGALLLACALACELACAQPALQPSSAASAAERAQKESDRTMYWIRVLATTPAPVKAAPAPRPAAVPAPTAEAREKARAAAVQAPATSPNVAPAPKAVAHASNPAQPPVANAPEPSTLSSRHVDSTTAGVANTQAAPPLDVAPSPAPEPDPGLIQIKSVQPEFPVAVVERIRKGHVEVRFEVEPGGKVVDATVVESSNRRLDNAAMEAVMQWRFKPTSASHTALVDLVFNIEKQN